MLRMRAIALYAHNIYSADHNDTTTLMYIKRFIKPCQMSRKHYILVYTPHSFKNTLLSGYIFQSPHISL